MKKGQATSIMVLILVIALFIVLYILMLPPEDRSSLLNADGNNSEGGNGGDVKEDLHSLDTLLLESPGLVFPTVEDKSVHEMNPARLFIKTEPEIDTLANSLIVSKGTFGSQGQNLAFGIEDIDNLIDTSLTFLVKEAKGDLSVELNGEIIFNNRLSAGNLKIIKLPLNLLKRENELKLSVNNPGIAFWSKNKYILEDIKIKKDFELINARGQRTFTLSKNELESLDRAKLKYFLFCNDLSARNNLFKVYINGEQLVSEVIGCVSGERNVDINLNDLFEGQNEILFVINGGDYSINQIKVENQLRESIFKTYFFNINTKDFFDVLDGNRDVFLQMSFEKFGTKIAEIWVNDFVIFMETDTDTFSEDISELVEEGENFIRIIPDTEFLIRSLRVTLE